MTIKDMHYDFKKKFNKIDSQQNKNLLIPEIDWTLEEAQNVYVDIIAQPRLRTYMGFEKSQKNTEDIRTLVVTDHCSNIPTFTQIEGQPFPLSNTISLPTDYRYFIKGDIFISKGICTNVKARLHIREHDDEFEESDFDSSSFEWRNVNGLFTQTGIKIYSDGTFAHNRACISYIRKPRRIHNAEDYAGGSYTLPSGQVLTGSVSCELPEHTHSEIVDIAVLIATGELQVPDYQIKQSKVGLNFLK